MRLPRDRFDYSPIAARPPWKLPKGARIAVWTIVNVEEWDIEKAMARQYLPAPQGVATMPDVPNWAWHDYGMRVGFWRLLDALAKRKIRATTAINAHVVRILRAGRPRDARRRLGVHGPRGRPGRDAPAPRPARGHPPGRRAAGEVHRQEAQGLARARPHRDVGDARLSPRRGGIEYVSDWVNDDQPYEIRTTSGPARLRALLARAERHPDDGGPAPHLGGVAAARRRTSSTGSTPRGRRTRG